jgi:hypothetical protein
MLAYVGDLSHLQLQVLDNLKRKGLTYNGWEADEEIKVFLTCREIIRKKQNNIHMWVTALIHSFKHWII